MKNNPPDYRKLFPCNPPDLEPIIEKMLEVRKDILQREMHYKKLDKIHPNNLKSARNLLHYMAFRLHDMRECQLLLSEWGLSSLGRAERKVQATVDTVLHTLHVLAGRDFTTKEKPPLTYQEGRQILEKNTENLLGIMPAGRRARIMVTMPSTASENYDLIKNLLLNGMTCARINCAHDDPQVWEKMIANIRRAEAATDLKCKIHIDLGGPKLRTGPIEPGPAVLKVRPQRSEMGEVEAPAKVWLFAEDKKTEAPETVAAALPMPADWLKHCRPGDAIRFRDARGAKRQLFVVENLPGGVMTDTDKTIYFTPGLTMELVQKEKKAKRKTARLVEGLPRKEGMLFLKKDDLLLLTKHQAAGHNAVFDEENKMVKPATVSISIPSVLDDAQEGEPIWFDDGKIEGIIEKKEPGQIHVRILQTKPGGEFLKAEKGINLPETDLSLPALTDEDKEHLKFVVKHADMVGLSFANHPKDVEDLVALMCKMTKGTPPAVVLKIETKLGFDNLPAMLLSAMQLPSCGVMIARGDLAIECGFGRLAEVQEQILWVCEAAHVPVIWATQVLEGLAKQGLPTRAEVTDAAMGQRAECIMLNKGEHIVEATKALSGILMRMQDHQTKKRSLLRRLGLAERFFEKNNH